MTKVSHWILAAAATALMAGGALAQESGGVKIRGNTNINVNADNVNTMAVGQGNTATTSIGSVQSSRQGSSNVSVDVKNVQNVVGGHGRKGCVSIGSQGACE